MRDDKSLQENPIDQNDKGAQAYAQLRELLLFNRRPPGMQINIRDMAEELGVSATPIREALIRLAVEGVVLSVANKGFYTKPLNVQELLAEYELAIVVLRYAIRKNVGAFTIEGLARPLELVLNGAGDIANFTPELGTLYAVYFGALFERVVSLSSNINALLAIRRFNDRIGYICELDMQSPERLLQAVSCADTFIVHMHSGDIDSADASLTQHFEQNTANLYELVKEGNARALSGLF